MADGAFSFVDRIIEIDVGRRARGRFALPPQWPPLSQCLMAEAVGQLAAWVAMAAAQFRRRPVAALARDTRLLGDAPAGGTLDLVVELEECDDDVIAYDGWATCDGRPVIELQQCIGPMLPMEDFDAPGAVRERFEALCNAGAACPVADDVFPLQHGNVRCVEPGQRMVTTLHVPLAASFFTDHFPRKALFPATLLLDAQMRLAVELATTALSVNDGTVVRPTRVRDVKMRAFVAPGQALELEARMLSAAATAEIAITASADGKRVSAARVDVGPWEAH